MFEEASQKVAAFFHVPPERLLLTPGCTSALQLAVADHAWKPGDRVLTTHFEHHAMHRCFDKLSQRGVQVKVLPYAGDQLVQLDAAEAELRRGDVRLVAMTAACNVTGLMAPVQEMIKLAQRYDALTLIDGAQIAGWWDLDLMQLGVDLFTFAGHKGPQAPWGIGGLYVREGAPLECPAAVCDLASLAAKEEVAMPGYCDAGSVDMASLAGLAAACDWLNEPQQSQRLTLARKHAAAFTTAIGNDDRVKVYHPSPMERKMPTVALTVEGFSTAALGKRLRDQGVIASAGFQCAPQAHTALGTTEEGVVRFSFGPTSTAEDATRCAEIFQAVLARGEA